MAVAIPIESLLNNESSSTTPSNSATNSGNIDLDNIIENAINGIANEIIDDIFDKLRKRSLSCKSTITSSSARFHSRCVLTILQQASVQNRASL
jgi:hypothetical protein